MSLPNEKKRKIFDGRYEILSIVGRGADSVVYRARHTTGAAQEVAIKVLVNRGGENTLTDKLRKEALTLVSCRHKYVVRLDDFHSIKDLCYLSMEYAPFGDLIKYTSKTDNKLSAEQVGTFLRQTLEALDFVHATGVIHRDLKPENILVVDEKEIRLADFGLALLPGDELELDELRNAVGTFDYLAPEVLDGVRYDNLSDLYSLGVCFYEVATGVHPFRNVPLARQHEIRQDGAIQPIEQLAPDLAPNIAATISTLMRFSAADRFQSATDALRAIRDIDFRSPAPSLSPTSRSQTGASGAITQSPERTWGDVPQAAQPFTVTQPEASQVGSAVTKLDKPSTVESNQSASTPANDDVVANRSTQPTEKIDLERVKSIISRDSQRGSSSASGSSGFSSSTNRAPSSESTRSETMVQARDSRKGVQSPPSKNFNTRGFSARSTVAKSAAVTLVSTIFTIGAILAWSSFSKKPSADSPTTQGNTETENSETLTASGQVEEPQSSPDAVLALSKGFYAGAIRGLFPGRDIPLALISDQTLGGGVVLILGIEGWAPSKVALPATNPDQSSATFRSNGLILQFNRELSSDKITGTVLDVVTGETGVWSVEKTS
jgi:serine/threonine protein kinase